MLEREGAGSQSGAGRRCGEIDSEETHVELEEGDCNGKIMQRGRGGNK